MCVYTHTDILGNFRTSWCFKQDCNVKQPQYISFPLAVHEELKRTCRVNSNQLTATSVDNMNNSIRTMNFPSVAHTDSSVYCTLFYSIFSLLCCLLLTPHKHTAMNKCNSEGAGQPPECLYARWSGTVSAYNPMAAPSPSTHRFHWGCALIKVTEWWRRASSISL